MPPRSFSDFPRLVNERLANASPKPASANPALQVLRKLDLTRRSIQFDRHDDFVPDVLSDGRSNVLSIPITIAHLPVETMDS